METERTDYSTDSVSSVEKMCLQYPNLPKGEFLIQISQDEQDTHETQSEATFDSDDTQFDTRLLYAAIHLRQ